jgi:hypothetical protein
MNSMPPCSPCPPWLTRQHALRLRRLGAMLSTLALATALAACEAPAPSPPLDLPVLERPVRTLTEPPAGAPGVLVPRAALVERGGLPGVFVLADGLARFRMVKTGKPRGALIEVLSGLHGDETLVLGELADVRDGSPIRTR